MSAIVKGELPSGVLVRWFRLARALSLDRGSSVWPAACLIVWLILFTSPLRAQTFEPSFTVGAGIQTSYQHIEADAAPDDQFSLGHARIYLSGDITKNISVMFNTDYNVDTNGGTAATACRYWTRWGSSTRRPQVQRLVRPFSSAERPRQLLPARSTPTSGRVYDDGIQDGYPSIFQGRDNGVAYWGDFKAGMAKIKASGRRIRRRLLHGGDPEVSWAGRAPARFLGSGERLLPEQHLLRGQKPARHRGATQVQAKDGHGETDGHNGGLPDGEEGARTAGPSRSKASSPTTTVSAGITRDYGKSQGAYGLASFLDPKVDRHRQVRGPRQVRHRGVYRWSVHLWIERSSFPSYRQNTTEVNFNYIIKQFDARVMSFYRNTHFNAVNLDSWEAGVGLQLQISKPIQ